MWRVWRSRKGGLHIKNVETTDLDYTATNYKITVSATDNVFKNHKQTRVTNME
jgi:hypothetical protein